MNNLKNVSYFFVPFAYDDYDDFRTMIKTLGKSSVWEQVHDEITYMLKYVADKIDSHNEDTCQCFHYVLKQEGRNQFGLGNEEDWFSTVAHTYQEKEEPIRFQISNVQLYWFPWEKSEERPRRASKRRETTKSTGRYCYCRC